MVKKSKFLACTMSFLFCSLFFFGQGNGSTVESIKDCKKRIVNVTVHILLDSLGQQNITNPIIASSIDTANKYFAPICTEFKICTTFIHPNVRNDKIIISQNRHTEISTLYNIQNTLNIYFVEQIQGGLHTGHTGEIGTTTVDPLSPLRDAIFISKSMATGTNNALMRQLGHFFGLYMTHETQFGNELVNQNNCTTTGDQICDTQADPGPALLDGQCQLATPRADANGDYYTPPTCNIMSHYDAFCNREFTNQQYNKMLEVMEKGRNYLW